MSCFQTTPRGDGSDDLVFSGAESGCFYDQEECQNEGSGSTQDALVKAVSEVHMTGPTRSVRGRFYIAKLAFSMLFLQLIL